LHSEGLHILYSSPDIILADKIRENEVGGTYGMHGRGEESVEGFGGKARWNDCLEDTDDDGRMGSEWILGRLAGGSM
jgi:hypothetical protein